MEPFLGFRGGILDLEEDDSYFLTFYLVATDGVVTESLFDDDGNKLIEESF